MDSSARPHDASNSTAPGISAHRAWRIRRCAEMALEQVLYALHAMPDGPPGLLWRKLRRAERALREALLLAPNAGEAMR